MREGWEEIKLIEILNIRTGKLDSNAAVEGGKFPFFTCSPETLRIDSFAFDTTAILLAGNNATGLFPVKFYSGKFNCYQRTYVLEQKGNRADLRFLYYQLQLKLIELRNISVGAATKFLTLPILNNISFFAPQLDTQRKIASILSAYDDLIENNLQRIKLLDELAQRTYEEWFVKFRVDGMDLEVDAGTGLPLGWEQIPCIEAMDVMSGGTPKTDVAEYWNGTVQFYTPKDAANSAYTNGTEKLTTDLGVSKCNSKLYPTDTVFITARGTVGKLNLAAEPMAMNQSCYALKGKGYITQLFLYNSLLSTVGQFKGAANGGVFDTIVVDTFRHLSFVKPTMEMVDSYTDFVRPIYDQTKNLLYQNRLLKESRDILLPRLMSGEVEV